MLHDIQLDSLLRLQVLRKPEPDVAAADDRDQSCPARRRLWRQLPLERPHPLARAHQHNLVAGVQHRPATGDRRGVTMMDGDDDDAVGQRERGDRPAHQRRVGPKPELEQPDLPAGERPGVHRPGSHDDSLDRVRQLRLGPDDLVDPEMLAQALASLRCVDEVLLGDEADRATTPQLAADRAGDDVDLVEPGAGDQQVARTDPRALEHTAAGAATLQKFDVEQSEPVCDARLGIDHAQFVVGRQRLGERIPDLAPPMMMICIAVSPRSQKAGGRRHMQPEGFANCISTALTRQAPNPGCRQPTSSYCRPGCVRPTHGAEYRAAARAARWPPTAGLLRQDRRLGIPYERHFVRH